VNQSPDMLSIVALCGWLVLALSSYAAYRFNLRKTVTMALAWAAIFAGMTAIIALIQESASIGETIGLTFL